MSKYLIPILFIVFISLFQFFFNNLFYPLSALNLVLIVIVYLIFNYDFSLSFLFGLGSSIILELYSPYPFGFLLIAAFITISVANFLFLSFFTGKSLLSLVVLSFSSFITYNFALGIFNFLNFETRIGRSFSAAFYLNIFWQCLLNLVVLVAIYLTSNILANKYKSSFFVKNEKFR